MTMDEGTRGTMDDKRDAEYRSVSTEDLHTESRGPQVVVQENSDGEIVANGTKDQLATGDITNPTETRQVLQTAFDEGGHVLVRRASQDYVVDVAGQDKVGADYSLDWPSYTDIELEQGAVIRYDAETSITPPDTSTILRASGATDIRLRGRGKLDAGYHRTDQPDDHDNDTHVIKIGEKEKGDLVGSGWGCTRFIIEGITISGGCRHGIEVGAASGDLGNSGYGVIKNVVSDDGAGDDDFCAGGPVTDVTFRGCIVLNRQRAGRWGNSGFEADDGPRNILFDGCRIYNPPNSGIDGFAIGKTHPWASDSVYWNRGNHAVDCYATGCQRGVVVSHAGGTVSDTRIKGLTAHNCGTAVDVHPRNGATLDDVVIDGGRFSGCDIGVEVRNRGSGVLDKLEWCGTTLENVGEGADFTPNGETVIDIDNVDIKTTGNGIHVKRRDVDDPGTIDISVTNSEIVGDGDQRGLFFDSNSTPDILYDSIRVEGCEIDSFAYAVAFSSSLTDTEVAGDGLIIDNSIRNSASNEFGIPNSSVRQYIRILGNGTGDDFAATVPSAPYEGMRYWDDGSNTGSGTKGERRYLGGAWTDIWTA